MRKRSSLKNSNTFFTEFKTFLKEKTTLASATAGNKNIATFQSILAKPIAFSAQFNPATLLTPIPVPAITIPGNGLLQALYWQLLFGAGLESTRI